MGRKPAFLRRSDALPTLGPMAEVHPSSIVSPEAQLGDSVRIGPHCVVDGPVHLAEGVHLIAGVHLSGRVRIGEGTVCYPGACIGFPPQDFKFAHGALSAGVEIGAGCLIREHATIHGASNDQTPTKIGNRVFMMVNTHVGHDASVGDHCVLVNNTAIAGHCHIGERVNFGGAAIVHQHCRVGRLAMIAGGSAFSADCPPFMILAGRNNLAGINIVGLKRNGFSVDDIATLRRTFRRLFRQPSSRDRLLAELDEGSRECAPLGELADFVRGSKRGICPGAGRRPRNI